MTTPKQTYQEIIVESFRPYCTNGLHGPIHIRPLPGQGLDTHMMVECSKSLSYAHPVGALFRIRAKITSKEGGTSFVYSSYKWPVSIVSPEEAARYIQNNSPWSW